MGEKQFALVHRLQTDVILYYQINAATVVTTCMKNLEMSGTFDSCQ